MNKIYIGGVGKSVDIKCENKLVKVFNDKVSIYIDGELKKVIKRIDTEEVINETC